jgi:putative tryptophan/tyrosine transport system substrate-binding protein
LAGEKRSNTTHRSTTDPDARLMRNGLGKQARWISVSVGNTSCLSARMLEGSARTSAAVSSVTTTYADAGYSGGMGSPAFARRRFLQGGLALAGLGVVIGCGRVPFWERQPPRVPRIGVLSAFNANAPAAIRYRQAFVGGLRDLGYEDGGNVAIDFRYAEAQLDRTEEQAVELAGLPVDVIVLSGDVAIVAARRATDRIPIVFALNSAPVESGMVVSLSRPGGNVTGLTEITPELSGKRLELLRAVLPNLTRVGVVWSPQFPGPALQYQELEVAARAIGQELMPLPVRTPEDLEPAIDAARSQAEALIVLTGALTNPHAVRVVELVTGSRLPAIYGERLFVQAGGLMSYGADVADMWRRAAGYVDKILKGASAANLPVERPTEFDFVVNLKTARSLGLTIPQSVLQQTTEIIQ